MDKQEHQVLQQQYADINKFVTNFLSKLTNDTIFIEAWRDRRNLAKIKALLQKATNDDVSVRRPKSKYIFFCEYTRPEIKQQFPELSIREITCELGKKWQEHKLNPDLEMEEKITKNFEEEKERYNAQKKPKNKQRFKSAYLYFCSQERLKQANISMKELGEKWNDIKNNDELHEQIIASFNKMKQETL